MTDLFDQLSIPMGKFGEPMAERLRPKSWDEIVGQESILGRINPLADLIKKNKSFSLILVGPPGSGKTTIARLIASGSQKNFVELSAVNTGVSEIKKILNNARIHKPVSDATILFIDEIHRFTKSQQDSFLPYIETGAIRLIGATTEDPNFQLNSALLSRLIVLKLNPLKKSDLEEILVKAEVELEKNLPVSKGGRDFILNAAQGDARKLINLAEIIFLSETKLEKKDIESLFEYQMVNYSKTGSDHFNCISALQKSIRGSDVDAALYWLARMLNAGEDPHYILRRILRTSFEDIGLANIQAQQFSLSAWSSFERLGSPEGDIVLAQAVIYLALSPKSNSAYKAYAKAQRVARDTPALMPQKFVRSNNVYGACSEMYEEKYISDHDTAEGFSGQQFLPDELIHSKFYQPIERGDERELVKRLSYFNRLRELKRS